MYTFFEELLRLFSDVFRTTGIMILLSMMLKYLGKIHESSSFHIRYILAAFYFIYIGFHIILISLTKCEIIQVYIFSDVGGIPLTKPILPGLASLHSLIITILLGLASVQSLTIASCRDWLVFNLSI